MFLFGRIFIGEFVLRTVLCTCRGMLLGHVGYGFDADFCVCVMAVV